MSEATAMNKQCLDYIFLLQITDQQSSPYTVDIQASQVEKLPIEGRNFEQMGDHHGVSTSLIVTPRGK